jgi:hypothetical protein
MTKHQFSEACDGIETTKHPSMLKNPDKNISKMIHSDVVSWGTNVWDLVKAKLPGFLPAKLLTCHFYETESRICSELFLERKSPQDFHL